MPLDLIRICIMLYIKLPELHNFRYFRGFLEVIMRRLLICFVLFHGNMIVCADIHDQDRSLFGRIKDAMGSAASSVIQTIKSDLGLGGLRHDPDQKISAMQHIMHATRVAIYGSILDLAATSIIRKIKPEVATIPQFKEDIPFEVVALFVPLIEEIFFSYLPVALLGSKAQVIMPPLFGAYHYHEDPSKYFEIGITAAMHNLLVTRSLCKNKHYSATPVLSHMMHNALWYCLMKHKMVH